MAVIAMAIATGTESSRFWPVLLVLLVLVFLAIVALEVLGAGARCTVTIRKRFEGGEWRYYVILPGEEIAFIRSSETLDILKRVNWRPGLSPLGPVMQNDIVVTWSELETIRRLGYSTHGYRKET